MVKFIDVVNTEKREATMHLYGGIGSDIDGDYFAREMVSLDSQVDTVNIRLNCPGGNVIKGLSMVSAALSMKAFVHIYIDGIGASMGAVFAVCGDKVSIMDYAKIMIHDPFFLKENRDKMTPKEQKALDSITDILRTILSRRGCDKDKIAQLMQEETWFTAEEALAMGLVDEIVSSKRKDEFKGLSTSEILSRIGNEYKPNTESNMDLKAIANKLGLPETATEQQILDEMAKRETAASQNRQQLVNHYMTLGTANGTVTEANKDRMTRLAAADFDLFVEMVTDSAAEEKPAGKQQTPAGNGERLSSVIGQLKTQAAAGATNQTAKTWDWYQRNDPAALNRLEKENPTEFNKLLDEYENGL